MSFYTVDSNELYNTSTLINSCADSIRSQVQTMMGYLQNLENSWKGSASAQFQGLTTNWHHAQSQVEEALCQISSQLNIAANNYSQAESDVASLFSM